MLLVLLAACGDGDPCQGVTGACIALHVDSPGVAEIDQLELDVLYGARHATTTTAAGTVSLPVATAVEIATTAPIEVGIVAAGKLAGNVLGTGAGSVMLDPGQHATLRLELAPPATCTAGAFYCGGDKLAGDPDTLYQCNGGGVPLARGRCMYGCLVRPTQDDVCNGGGGTCTDGGQYCGGDKLDGDPQTLYTCAAGVGTQPMRCPNECVVRTGQNDICT